MNEDQHSIELAIWLDRRNILYTHVPNGGLRGAREAAKFQRMGVKRGVPDYLIFTPPPLAVCERRGVAIEMKREQGGACSEAQFAYHAKLQNAGWLVYVSFGHTAAINTLTALGYDRDCALIRAERRARD